MSLSMSIYYIYRYIYIVYMVYRYLQLVNVYVRLIIRIY
jgi:hypothetical protein